MKGVCIILIMMLFLTSKGQVLENPFRNIEKITTQDGLSQNDIFAILQDSDGYLWFGTNEGLNKYDGYSFEVYDDIFMNQQVNGVLIRCICEDDLGRVWTGKLAGGLDCYDPVNRTVVTYRNTMDERILAVNTVHSMLKVSNGDIWTEGLDRIVIDKDGKVTISNHRPNGTTIKYNGLSHWNVTTLMEDSHRNLWVGTMGGLNIMERDTLGAPSGHYKVILSKKRISELAYCGDTYFIAGVSSVFQFKFDKDFNVISRDVIFDKVSNIHDLLIDLEQKLWIATDNGIYIYDDILGDGIYRQCCHLVNGENRDNLSSNNVNTIILDNSGIVWIGTTRGGVNKINPRKVFFQSYSVNPQTRDNVITSVYEDCKERLWFGVEHQGINIAKTNNYNSTAYSTINLNQGSLNQANDIISIPNSNKLLVATERENYLVEIDVNTFTKRVWGNLIAAIRVENIFIDDANYLWISADMGMGAARYNIESGELIILKVDYEDREQKILRSTNIFEDLNGNIWLAGMESLYFIDRDEKHKKQPYIKRYTSTNSGLSVNNIGAIIQDVDSNMWFGTIGGGINLLEKRFFGADSIHFTAYRKKDGMLSNIVQHIIEDDDRNLWISTNKGISKFNLDTRLFRNFDISEGLQQYEFCYLSGCKRANGDILFGGVNGYNAFNPKEIFEDTVPPIVRITDFSLINTKKVDEEEERSQHLYKRVVKGDDIELAYYENSFTIKFTGINYTVPEKNIYRYKLDGFDEDWVFVSSANREAKYTNLYPGHYKFKVLAANADHHWNEKGAVLEIEIDKPFWHETWFIIVIAGFVMLFIYGLLKFRVRYLLLELNQRKKYEEQLKIAKLKAEESDRLKSAILANMSHEIRTPINAILGFSSLILIRDLTRSKLSEYLGLIRKSSMGIVKIIDSILSISEISSDSKHIDYSSFDINQILDESKLDFETEINEQKKDLTLQINNLLDKNILTTDIGMLSTVIKSIIENAVKFSKKGTVIITIIPYKADLIKFTVADEGIGIDPGHHQSIFDHFRQVETGSRRQFGGLGLGLTIAKSYVEKLGGQIWLDSELGKGASFHFTIQNKVNQ